MYRMFRDMCIFPAVCLMFLLAACTAHIPAGDRAAASPPTVTATPKATQATETSCPKPGTARAAVMDGIKLGKNQTIVYATNRGTTEQPAQSTIERYDVSTHKQTAILDLPQQYIYQAHLSADGQWILFTVRLATKQTAIQLVRLDGQELQTLYCSEQGILNSHWSPDQQILAFADGPDLSTSTVFLLHLKLGTLQLAVRPGTPVVPAGWLSNTSLSMTSFLPNTDAPPRDLYVLDTKNGAGQQLDDLRHITPINTFCFDFDSNATSFFFGECTNVPAEPDSMFLAQTGPSTMKTQPTTGDTARSIYTSETLAVTAVRVAPGNKILFLITNTKGDTSQNGLWSMQLDGSGIQRLAKTPQTLLPSLNPFSRTLWSNVSRDGTLYAFKEENTKDKIQQLSYGSLTGRQPATFAQLKEQGTLNLVGWTTS